MSVVPASACCAGLRGGLRDRDRRAVRRVVGAQGLRPHPDAVRPAARPGPFGLLQTLADTLKLVLKEDITPRAAQTAASSAWRRCSCSRRSRCRWPSSRSRRAGRRSTRRSGVLFFLAVPSVSVLGILLGGWSSGNTYATIGGLRGAAQMISYELPRTLVGALASCCSPARCARSAIDGRVALVVAAADARSAFVVYFVASIAEMNRGPFDLARGRVRARGGLLRRLLRHPLGDLHDGRVRRHARRLAVRRRDVPRRRCAGCPARSARSRSSSMAIVLVTVMIWVKWTLPAHAARPADVARVEGAHADGARAAAWSSGAVAPWLGRARSAAARTRLGDDRAARASRRSSAAWASMLTGLGITGRDGAAEARRPCAIRPRRSTLSPAVARRAAPARRRSAATRSRCVSAAPPALQRASSTGCTARSASRRAWATARRTSTRAARTTSSPRTSSPRRYELVRERNILPGVLGRICHHPCETRVPPQLLRRAARHPPAAPPRVRGVRKTVRAERVEPLPEHARAERSRSSAPDRRASSAALDLMRLGLRASRCTRRTTSRAARCTRACPATGCRARSCTREIDDLVTMGLDLRCGVEVGARRADRPAHRRVRRRADRRRPAGLAASCRSRAPTPRASWARSSSCAARTGTATPASRGKRVFVIGGGNVAVDVARCALRVGATEVRLGLARGATTRCRATRGRSRRRSTRASSRRARSGPRRCSSRTARSSGMRMRECLSVFDETGPLRAAVRRGPHRRSRATWSCSPSARRASSTASSPARDLELDERGNLVGRRLRCSRPRTPGVFACGEVVTGPGQRASASIATGHEAATSIHRFLQGEDLVEGPRRPARCRSTKLRRRRTLEGVEDVPAAASRCRWRRPRSA